MIFPKFLKKGSMVGCTAPSDGCDSVTKINGIKNSKPMLEKNYGFKVVFTENCFTCDGNGRSSNAFERANQFHSLIDNGDVDWIVSCTGGDYLVEILEYIDFDLIKNNPKWIQGYSDNTSLLYIITTMLDIATVYGSNMSTFGIGEYKDYQKQNIDLLMGNTNVVHGFEKYQNGFRTYETGIEDYDLTEKTNWVNYPNANTLSFSGRLIGGCTEVIFSLVGTVYDKTLSFIEKYKNDGIIFYFETFASNSSDLYMHLWQLKNAGYFKYIKGFVFGRPMFYNSFDNKEYKDVVVEVLGSLNKPIIFDCDIGHKPPQMPIINGAYCTITSADGNGTIEYDFSK